MTRRTLLLSVITVAIVVVAAALLRDDDRSRHRAAPAATAGVPGARFGHTAAAAVAATPEDGIAREPAGDQRLEGQVVDANDQPVAGAIVTLDTVPARTTTSGEDGAFAFDDLLPRRYRLAAVAPGGIAGPVIARLDATSEPVILRLQPAGRVDVVVEDAETRSPVAGATIEVRAAAGTTATTDAHGRASATPVLPGRATLAVRAPGYGTALVPVLVGLGESVPIHISLPRGVVVRGKVVDAHDQPIEGALVWLSDPTEWTVGPDPLRDGARSAADGSFELAGAATGNRTLHSVARGHAAATVELAVGERLLDAVIVRHGPGGIVAGIVVTPDGTPVAGAVVQAQFSGGLHETRTGLDGAFALTTLPRAAVVVTARTTEAASARSAADLIGHAEVELRIVLEHVATISGTVVTPDSEPIDGAQVEVWPDSTSAGDEYQEPVRELTDAGGRFRIGGLEPGRYWVAAMRADAISRGLERTKRPVRVTAPAGDVAITLDADGAIEGRVAFTDGTTPPRYSVRLGRRGIARSQRDAAFTIEGVPPGAHSLWIEGPGFASTKVEGIVVRPDQTTDVGDVVVERGRTVRGEVVDGSGAPAPGAEVIVGAVLVGSGERVDVGDAAPAFQSDVRRVITDAQGRFVVDGVGVGPVSVVATHEIHGRSAAYALAAGTDAVEVRLPLGAATSVRGTVTISGRPASAIVVAQPHSAPLSMGIAMADERGSYQFARLAPGAWTFSAVVGDPGRGATFFPTVAEVRAGAPLALDLSGNPGGGRATVTVEGLDGAPAVMFVTAREPAARTALALVDELARTGTVWAMTSAAGGSAEFRDLPAGSYTACVIAPGGVPASMNTLLERIARVSAAAPVACARLEVPSTGAAQATVSAPR